MVENEDDIKAAESENNGKESIKNFALKFKLGTLAIGHGKREILKIHALLTDGFHNIKNWKYYLNSFTEHALSGPRSKRSNEMFNSTGNAFFAFLNSLLGWTGSAAGTLCSSCAFYFHQKTLDILLSQLVQERMIVCSWQKLGKVVSYLSPNDSSAHKLKLFVFVDVSVNATNGRLDILLGLLVKKFKSCSIIQCLSQISHKSTRLKLVTSAKMFACWRAIDEAKRIVKHC